MQAFYLKRITSKTPSKFFNSPLLITLTPIEGLACFNLKQMHSLISRLGEIVSYQFQAHLKDYIISKKKVIFFIHASKVNPNFITQTIHKNVSANLHYCLVAKKSHYLNVLKYFCHELITFDHIKRIENYPFCSLYFDRNLSTNFCYWINTPFGNEQKGAIKKGLKNKVFRLYCGKDSWFHLVKPLRDNNLHTS